MYIFFDTETTGLPSNCNSPITDNKNWPRMVQIAWMVFDKKQKLIKEKNYIIKADGFKIPRVASKIHGITNTISKKEGISIEKVLKEFSLDLIGAEMIIGHNVDFDIKIVGAEFYRLGISSIIESMQKFCTMKAGVDICKISMGINKYKSPKLEELYCYLFKETFDNQHNALADVKACAKCYWEILKMEENRNIGIEDGITQVDNLNILSLKFDEIGKKSLDMMKSSNQNLFLTGKAGTGKSTLLKYFLHDSLLNSNKKIVVLAPTGVAALNVGGSTLHSFFRIPPTITIDDVEESAMGSIGKKIYTELDTIVIDEISMVRADLLDCIDKYLKVVRKSDLPFGGVQMIFIGDLYQLPPVVTTNERQYFASYYDSPYFFSSKIFKNELFNMEYIELQKVYRQNDNVFVDILNAIRNKTINETHIQKLNMNVVGKDYDIKDGDMFLTGKNIKVNEINTKKLASLDSEEFVYQAEVRGKFKANQYPTDEFLTFKKGAQVMFVANDNQGRWVNGTLGKIIDLDEDVVVVKIYGGETVKVNPYSWNVRQYEYNKSLHKLETKTIGSFIQFPLALAWAVTIHKSQGKTFDKVIVDLGSGTFAHGQTYVALSRCRSLAGVSLVNPIKKGHVIMDWRIMNFVTSYQYNQSEKVLSLKDKEKILRQKVKDKAELQIVYLKRQDERSERLIKPIEIGRMSFKGVSFLGLRAFCMKANDMRTFRVDRILEIRE